MSKKHNKNKMSFIFQNKRKMIYNNKLHIQKAKYNNVKNAKSKYKISKNQFPKIALQLQNILTKFLNLKKLYCKKKKKTDSV